MTPDTRKELERIRGEIEQLFTDAEYYNSTSLPENEAPINPDPNGELLRMRDLINLELYIQH